MHPDPTWEWVLIRATVFSEYLKVSPVSPKHHVEKVGSLFMTPLSSNCWVKLFNMNYSPKRPSLNEWEEIPGEALLTLTGKVKPSWEQHQYLALPSKPVGLHSSLFLPSHLRDTRLLVQHSFASVFPFLCHLTWCTSFLLFRYIQKGSLKIPSFRFHCPS